MTPARHLHAVPAPQDDTGHDDAPDDALGGGVIVVPPVDVERYVVDYRVPAVCAAIMSVCFFGILLTVVWIVAAVVG